MSSFDGFVSAKSPRHHSYFSNILPKPVKSNSVSKKSNAPFPKKYSLSNSSEKKRESLSGKKEEDICKFKLQVLQLLNRKLIRYSSQIIISKNCKLIVIIKK